MALVRCTECGREISDQAPACPGCGAPPEVYAARPWTPDDSTDAGVETAAPISAATHSDGRVLTYDEASRAFDLGGVALVPSEVDAIDRQRKLTWTRLDVREVMRKTVKRGLPMGDLPVPGEPSMLERTSSFLEKAAEAAAPKSNAMVCPHCQSKGTVRTKQVKQKKGISGGKATAAVLTGGLSVLATGLSRKEKATEAHCTRCGNTWYF